MKKIALISFALLLLASMLIAQTPMNKGKVSSDPAMQHNPSFRDRLAPDDDMMPLPEELKLTDAQLKKLEELRTPFVKNRNTVHAEIENLEIDLHNAMQKENYSAAKEISKQINTKRALLADARIDFIAARMKELTPEQKEILQKHMMRMMPMHGKGKGMGMGMMKHHNQKQGNCNDCNDCDEHDKKSNPPIKVDDKQKMK